MPDNAPFLEFLTIEEAQRAREKTIRLDPVVAANYKDRNRILRWGDSFITILASLKRYTRIISIGRNT